ncbi:hypothetical protein H310_03683 [Aphanomyces invadans]|uniref:Uncharacterized protein n=1 Tax=Aphanomyces invadans TaxID=157072 RepID=A0A024UIG6_9STRA|nr:hypothetical protein H310_03683 [Aphanomyces invadans]ETW06089.1 hypothetical protein H310_03683 [Aphanomyces invadans]|eukprot:XP_008865866.1 hypothetical protein H310_03683 [Aphanomyces invadans]
MDEFFGGNMWPDCGSFRGRPGFRLTGASGTSGKGGVVELVECALLAMGASPCSRWLKLSCRVCCQLDTGRSCDGVLGSSTGWPCVGAAFAVSLAGFGTVVVVDEAACRGGAGDMSFGATDSCSSAMCFSLLCGPVDAPHFGAVLSFRSGLATVAAEWLSGAEPKRGGSCG